MTAPDFKNLSFETDVTGTPMEPDQWEVFGVGTAFSHALWGASPEPWADFDSGWNQAATVGSAILVSGVEPFALSDGDTLKLSFASGTPELIVIDTADFPDLATASASEVAAVISAVSAHTVEVKLGRILIKSSPFGDGVEVVGESPANEALGFPRAQLAFVADGADIEVLPVIDFERGWAGIAARLTTVGGETFAVSNSDTLDIDVFTDINGLVNTTVTFSSIAVGGSATALEILGDIALAVADVSVVAVPGTTQVEITNNFVGAGSLLRVTGGTAEAALNFNPASGSLIGDNGSHMTVLGATSVALWNTTNDNVESFEREHGSNEDFVWISTTDRIEVRAAVEAVTYVITVSTKGALEPVPYADSIETYEVVADPGDDADDIATAFASVINTSSNLMLAAAIPGPTRILFSRLSASTEVSLAAEVETTEPVASTAMAVGAESTGALIAAAIFTGETFEDYENAWDNNVAGAAAEFLWNIADEQLYVEPTLFNAANTYVLTITVNQGGADVNKVFTVVTPANVAALIASMTTEIDNDNDFFATDDGAIVRFWRDNSRLRIVSYTVNDPALRVGAALGPSSALPITSWDPASFRNVGTTETVFDFERFEVEDGDGPLSGTNVEYQHIVHIDDSNAGRYSIFIQGIEFFYNAGGGDSAATIAGELRDEINSGGGPINIEAFIDLPVFDIKIRSTTAPVTAAEDIGIRLDAPNLTDISATTNATFAEDNWTWDAFLRTLP